MRFSTSDFSTYLFFLVLLDVISDDFKVCIIFVEIFQFEICSLVWPIPWGVNNWESTIGSQHLGVNLGNSEKYASQAYAEPFFSL